MTARGHGRGAIWPRVLVGAAAAGLAAVGVGAWLSAEYYHRVEALHRELRAIRDDLERQRAILAIVRDPATRGVTLAGQPAAPAASGRMYWHAQAGGVLVAAGLPASPPGETYRLWATAGDRPPLPLGAFTVEAHREVTLRLAPRAGVEGAHAFSVTLEPAEAPPAPSGPSYLAGSP